MGEPAGGGLILLPCQGTIPLFKHGGGKPEWGSPQNACITACFKHGGGKPEWGSPQNACILWGPRVGGGILTYPRDEQPIRSVLEHNEQLERVSLSTTSTHSEPFRKLVGSPRLKLTRAYLQAIRRRCLRTFYLAHFISIAYLHICIKTRFIGQNSAIKRRFGENVGGGRSCGNLAASKVAGEV